MLQEEAVSLPGEQDREKVTHIPCAGFTFTASYFRFIWCHCKRADESNGKAADTREKVKYSGHIVFRVGGEGPQKLP